MIEMTAVNEHSNKLLTKLWNDANKNDGCKKYEKKGWMPLVVEILGADKISLAHYGELNGDLMDDPEMVFYKDNDDKFYPLSYQNDYAYGYYSECIDFENGKPVHVNEKKQRDMCDFFNNVWAGNIICQQNIKL
jgi:hypothetical protein